jgi:hypothetical protein
MPSKGKGKSGGGTKKVRDTRTGQYVPAKEAKRRPSTTVTETDKKSRK